MFTNNLISFCNCCLVILAFQLNEKRAFGVLESAVWGCRLGQSVKFNMDETGFGLETLTSRDLTMQKNKAYQRHQQRKRTPVEFSKMQKIPPLRVLYWSPELQSTCDHSPEAAWVYVGAKNSKSKGCETE